MPAKWGLFPHPAKWLAALGVLLGLASGRTALSAELIVGQPAPPLVLHSLDGRSIDTASLRGQVVILTFWATWCVPCREELPVLSAYAAQHAKQGLQVLAFSLDQPAALGKVREIASVLSFPVGLLGSNWAGDYGRMWQLPVSFVIDRNGVLRYDGWKSGPEPWTEVSLTRVVGPLL